MDVVLAAGGAVWETAAIAEIDSDPALRLVRRCVDVADLLALAHTDRAAAALVSVDLPGLDVDTVHRLERGGLRVAAVECEVQRSTRLGISRVVHLGTLAAVARDAPAAQHAGGDHGAPTIAVWGPAGAPGRSTVALGLASATAARGIDTILVDADTYGGSLGQMLSVLDDVSGLVAACRMANTGRASEVVDHLLTIDADLRLLTGLPRADMWPQVRTGAFELVLDRLGSESDLVVVDCGFSLESGSGTASHRNQTTLQVLARADEIVVVGRPDPVGLARLVRGLHDLAEIAPGCEPVLVLNLFRTSLGWREPEVAAALHRLSGATPEVCLPFDQAVLDLAAVSGRSPREAAPTSRFVTRLEALARTVMSRATDRGILSPVAP